MRVFSSKVDIKCHTCKTTYRYMICSALVCTTSSVALPVLLHTHTHINSQIYNTNTFQLRKKDVASSLALFATRNILHTDDIM